MSSSLGKRIASFRADVGWTQQDLADRIGISRVALSHLEVGLTVPGERTVALLASVFKVEPHELVAGTGYPVAKAEKLPVVVARYTEIEMQLALLEHDCARGLDRGRKDDWVTRLRVLKKEAHDAREAAAVVAALRALQRED